MRAQRDTPAWGSAGSDRSALALVQSARSAFFVAAGIFALLYAAPDHLLTTLLVFLTTTGLGLALCHAVRTRLQDPRLDVLSLLWLIKLALVLTLLYVGWIPQLDRDSSPSWGYDPQRYFYDAQDLLENGWNPLVGSNYQGVLFYYAAIFYVLGHNPVLPAMINSLITLTATLYAIRLAYEFSPQNRALGSRLAYLILIPEVLWYDAITSRETLAAALVLFAALSAGRFIVRPGGVARRSAALGAVASLLALLVVRTTMAVAVVAAIAAMATFLRGSGRGGVSARLLLLAAGAALIAIGPWVQQLTGGYNLDYGRMAQSLQSFDQNVAASAEWSENSLGLMLSPSGALQAVLFTAPRMVLYLASPLPDLAISLQELARGSWYEWQRLMTVATSVLNLIAFPYALAGFTYAWARRKSEPAPLVFHFAFWAVFVGIAGGNIIIQERYRVMMDVLFFTCAWLGYVSCTRAELQRAAIIWVSVLGAGATAYMAYKVL